MASLALLRVWLATSAEAADVVATDAAIKAASLIQIATYIDWPAGSFADGKAPFIIGVIGRNTFEKELTTAAATADVGGRPVVIRPMKEIDPAQRCHILFIAGSEKARLPQILPKAEGCGALTISDLDGFARQKGGVGIIIENKHLLFEINMDATDREKLAVNPRLLRLARVIRNGKPVN